MFTNKKKGDICFYIHLEKYKAQLTEEDVKFGCDVEVTKITKEHIYCKTLPTIDNKFFREERLKFRLNDGFEECEFKNAGKLYPSKQHFSDIFEREELVKIIIENLPKNIEKLKTIRDYVVFKWYD